MSAGQFISFESSFEISLEQVNWLWRVLNRCLPGDGYPIVLVCGASLAETSVDGA